MEHPAVRKRPESEGEEWRRSHSITVIGRGIPKPVYTFEEASMPGI
jgi:ATP-dependent RNA helicase DDX5/DBP2